LTDGSSYHEELSFGWSQYLLPTEEAQAMVECCVLPVSACETDSRELGLMIRSIVPVEDPGSYKRQLDRQNSFRLNQAEFESGAVILTSTPPQVRTTLETQCNIKPRCVYCHWDYAKELENRCDLNLGSVETLKELGVIIDMAFEVHDASWGEIFLNPEFPEIAEYLLESEAVCAFTTNGILMTEDKYRLLLGQPTRLYISLDASNAEMYSHYRNSHFDKVITNTRRLCHIKKQHDNKPEVHIVCIAMQSNIDDIPNVMDLAADMGADYFTLQALHKQNLSAPHTISRNGHQFTYDNECLDMGQLSELSERLHARANSLGIQFETDHTDFNYASVSDNNVPLCMDPWKTVWSVSRGIMPCAFGREPIAYWDERENKTVEQFILDAINNPAMQNIRRALAERKLSDYCRSCTSCSIVKRYTEAELNRHNADKYGLRLA